MKRDSKRVEHVFRWDLDKTYLDTDFDKVADLVKTAFQKAEEKRTIPGAGALLRALLAEVPETRRAVYFISGSPRQMRKVLEKKLEIDGIRPDAFVLKPNLQNLLLLRFRALRGQLGYKLRALLDHQPAELDGVPETLFGDDAEQDAVIYSIYAEVLAGRIRGDRLSRLLQSANVYSGDAKAILARVEAMPHQNRVRRIFIKLDRKSPPGRFRPYMPRLVPVYNYFQAALVLFQDSLLTANDVVAISLDMIENDGYNPFALTNSMQDVVRRGHLAAETIQNIGRSLLADYAVDEIARRFLDEFAGRIEALHGYQAELPEPSHEEVDYVSLLEEELSARKRHKQQQRLADRLGKSGLF